MPFSTTVSDTSLIPPTHIHYEEYEQRTMIEQPRAIIELIHFIKNIGPRPMCFSDRELSLLRRGNEKAWTRLLNETFDTDLVWYLHQYIETEVPFLRKRK